MNRLAILLVSASLALVACTDSGETSEPTATPSATATSPVPTATPELPSVDALLIHPGAVGPAEVGMSADEALATGMFEAEPRPVADECEEPFPLRWTEDYSSALDVYTDAEGRITSIGVHTPGPRTEDGLAVGSTLDHITDAYETAEMVEAGFDQTGVYLTDGDRWLGFLLDESLENVTGDSTVIFIEVTDQSRPSLMRDGC